MKGDRFLLDSEGINKIRDEIINAVYLASSVFGTLSFYGAVMRVVKQGYHPIIIFYSILFASIWTIFLLRKHISTHWKAAIFFVLFFLAGTFLNLANSVISGALHFIFVSTIITLLYGWRWGALSVVLSVITRLTIAILFIKGVLSVDFSFNEYATSIPIIISTILGALFTAAVIVFAINKFYHWLIQTLHTVTDKVKELEQANAALEIAKSKAIENDRLKTVFLTNMSHEVRTPMNAIIGFSSLLGKPGLTEEKRQRYSNLVSERSYDLLRLIEDILDVSKIEIGLMTIEESETNLRQLLQEITDFYALRLQNAEIKKDVSVKLTLEPSAENRMVYIDKGRLKQIINNLIDNAIKFTKQGTVEIGCKIEEQIHFYVKDSGIGIPKEKQQIIFDRFRQADESITARQYGGTGLGLSICKGILDLMGGDICVDSEEGKGATFYFSIPLVDANSKENQLVRARDVNVNFSGKSVLIVEDDKINAEYIDEILAESNLKIFHGYTGSESLNILKNEPAIDLLLLDVRLPDMSGLELAKKLRKAKSDIKIIAQTAYASAYDINACLSAGCDSYIAKPIDSGKLLKLMNEYLSA